MIRIGDTVSAIALPADGGGRVKGKVLDVWNGIVLLDLPHGSWCLLKGARVQGQKTRRLLGKHAGRF